MLSIRQKYCHSAEFGVSEICESGFRESDFRERSSKFSPPRKFTFLVSIHLPAIAPNMVTIGMFVLQQAKIVRPARELE